MNTTHDYKTLATSSEGIYREKGSKFYAYAFPISSVEGAKIQIEHVKEMHPKAKHHC